MLPCIRTTFRDSLCVTGSFAVGNPGLTFSDEGFFVSSRGAAGVAMGTFAGGGSGWASFFFFAASAVSCFFFF